MKKNYSYPTTIWVSILTKIYVFLYYLQFCFWPWNIYKQKLEKYLLFYQKFVHLGENTFPYCSRIIAVHVYVNVFFLKFTQRVTILQTE